MKTWISAVCVVLSLAAVGGLPAQSFGKQYKFINIADTNGPFSAISHHLGAINDSGVVAFAATLDNGVRGVFTGSGGPVTTVADSAGVYSHFGDPDINNSGVVAFSATHDNGTSGVYTKNGSLVTTIETGGIGSQFTGVGGAWINESGTVAFLGGKGRLNEGLYTSNGGPTTTIIEGLDGVSAFFEGFAGINDSGTVGFMIREYEMTIGGPWIIYAGDGGPLTRIADSYGYGYMRLGESINNSGTVIFNGYEQATSKSGIFTSNGGPITHLELDTGLSWTSDGDAMAINNSDDIAFIGLTRGGTGHLRGIYTGPDPVADKVIREGDSLFGSTVRLLAYERLVLNDRGSIAFHYQLANGVRGLAVASVPEPACATLIAIAAAVLWQRRRSGTVSSTWLTAP